jgi:hypothetical protein
MTWIESHVRESELTRWVDGTLGEDEAALLALKAHILVCDECASRAFGFTAAFGSARPGAIQAGPELPDRELLHSLAEQEGLINDLLRQASDGRGLFLPDPAIPVAIRIQAEDYRRLGQHEEAIQRYVRLIEEFGDSADEETRAEIVEALVAQADEHWASGDLSAVIGYLTELVGRFKRSRTDRADSGPAGWGRLPANRTRRHRRVRCPDRPG